MRVFGRKTTLNDKNQQLSLENNFDQAKLKRSRKRNVSEMTPRERSPPVDDSARTRRKKHHTKRQHNRHSIQNKFDEANREHARCRRQSFMTSRERSPPFDDSARIREEKAHQMIRRSTQHPEQFRLGESTTSTLNKIIPHDVANTVTSC